MVLSNEAVFPAVQIQAMPAPPASLLNSAADRNDGPNPTQSRLGVERVSRASGASRSPQNQAVIAMPSDPASGAVLNKPRESLRTPWPLREPPAPLRDAMAESVERLIESASAALGAGVRAPATAAVFPLHDLRAGHHTIASKLATRTAEAKIRQAFPGLAVSGFTAHNLPTIDWLISGGFLVSPGDRATNRSYSVLMCLVLVDLRDGKVLGRDARRLKPDGVDLVPLGLYRDSALVFKTPGTLVDESWCTPDSNPSILDPQRLTRLKQAALFAQSIERYEANDLLKAAQLLRELAGQPGDAELPALSALDVVSVRLGEGVAQSQARSRILALQLRAGALLLNSESQQFSGADASPKGRGRAIGWLDALGQGLAKAKTCVTLIMHDSSTVAPNGTEPGSLSRGDRLADELTRRGKLRFGTIAVAEAVREAPLIGTASDDVRDQWDRRVELVTRPCFQEQSSAKP
jgi:hypothetical protein